MCGSAVTASVHRAIARLSHKPRQAPPRPPLDISRGQIVDLTHILTPEFPMWPGDPQFSMTEFSPLGGDTFYANTLALHEHSGTHIDAPAHAAAGGVTVEAIPAATLIAPLAIIDISARAAADPDALLSIADILDWERLYGELPLGSLLALRADWSTRAGDAAAYLNLDPAGVMRTPGFDPTAVRFLVERRDVVGIGTDTMSIDAGRSEEFGAHVAALGSGLYAVESLTNLAAVPAAGAIVIVGAPTHRGGSGGPARVLAVVPQRL